MRLTLGPTLARARAVLGAIPMNLWLPPGPLANRPAASVATLGQVYLATDSDSLAQVRLTGETYAWHEVLPSAPTNPRTAAPWGGWALTQTEGGGDGTVAISSGDLVLAMPATRRVEWGAGYGVAPRASLVLAVPHRDAWAIVLKVKALTGTPDFDSYLEVCLREAVDADTRRLIARWAAYDGTLAATDTRGPAYIINGARTSPAPSWLRVAWVDGVLSLACAPELAAPNAAVRPEHWVGAGRGDTSLDATVPDLVAIDVYARQGNDAGAVWTVTLGAPELIDLGDGR